jgi:N,N'-diacetyllegionaminate synthase
MSKVFVIAEAGVNHNGSLELARELVRAGAAAGADAVKFQTFKAASLASRRARKAEYQEGTTGTAESQQEMLRKLELDASAYAVLKEDCARHGVQFLSTPFDLGSIDLLAALGMETWKIPSGEITNLPYLRKLGALRQRIILSTGMSGLGEIEAALGALEAAGTPRRDVTVLHATTEYPAPMHEVNLRAMRAIGDALGVSVGYSDHTPGIEIPIAAAALGARVVEKHFTLDRNMPGPDHLASLEPGELKAMVAAIRNVEKALGDGIKRPTPSEAKNIAVVRKSIVASRPIRKGEILTSANLTTKRPATGLSPMRWDELLGKPSPADFAEDEPIAW